MPRLPVCASQPEISPNCLNLKTHSVDTLRDWNQLALYSRTLRFPSVNFQTSSNFHLSDSRRSKIGWLNCRGSNESTAGRLKVVWSTSRSLKIDYVTSNIPTNEKSN